MGWNIVNNDLANVYFIHLEHVQESRTQLLTGWAFSDADFLFDQHILMYSPLKIQNKISWNFSAISWARERIKN